MTGRIYFVQAAIGGPIKIGHTAGDVSVRVGQLQVTSPFKLILIGSAEGSSWLERRIHERLTQYRLHGEWFVDALDVREAMASFLAGALTPEDFFSYETMGQRITTARVMAGMSRFDLALAVRTRERDVIRWEQDEHMPHLGRLLAIAEATGSDPEFLVTGIAEDNQ